MTTKKILIADDDRDLARALALRCEQLGLQTHVVYDAMSALTVAHAVRPDLICLDVNMPGGNGLSACEMISCSEDLVGIPVVVLTGRYDEDTIRRCHNMCAYYVLKCPDTWSRVEPLVYELLHVEPPRSESRPEGDSGEAGDGPDTVPLPELYREMAREVVYAQMNEAGADDNP